MPKPKNKRSCDAVDIHVAKRVRALRRSHDFTQTDLGDKIGIAWQQVQKYESATNRISVGRLVAIAKILKEPLGAFLPEGVAL